VWQRGEIRTIVEFFRGGLALGRAFSLWGILGGGIISLFSTLFALTLVTAGAPAWLAVLVFAAHIPWNLVLLVGVWRSAGRPEVSPAAANLARTVILAWVMVVSLPLAMPGQLEARPRCQASAMPACSGPGSPPHERGVAGEEQSREFGERRPKALKERNWMRGHAWEPSV
jgi:hypothetical protein